MIVYAESSAVLAWLLDDDRGDEVGGALTNASSVVASDLTTLECDRVLIRAWSSHLISEVERVDLSGRLARVAAHCAPR